MEIYDAVIDGFPPSLGEVKIKVYLESRTAKDSIKAVERNDDGGVRVIFHTEYDLRRFMDAKVEKVTFGETFYELNYRRNEFSEGKQMRGRRSPVMADQRDGETWRTSLKVTYIPPQLLHNREALKDHFSRFGMLTNFFKPTNGSYIAISYSNHNEALNAKLYGAHIRSGILMRIMWSHDEDPEYSAASDQALNRHFNHPPQAASGATDFGYHGGRVSNPSSSVLNQSSSMCPPALHDRKLSYLDLNVDQQYQNANTADIQANRHLGCDRIFDHFETFQNIQKADEKSRFQNIHHWNDLSNSLPGPPGSICALAQNIDPSIDMQTIKMHFQSKRRSGVGPIKCMVRMSDGVLIVFKNQNDCKSCIDTKSHIIIGKKIQVHRKVIPEFHARKFVIEGVGENTSRDVLIMFLEAHNEQESSPSLCKKTSSPGTYLVEFEEEKSDVFDTDYFLRRVSEEPLLEIYLKASKLLHTDCLKVTKVEPRASEDEIRMQFESKRRTNGGPVTYIDKLKDGSVLVYFEDFRDAERIHRRFVQPYNEPIMIAGKPIEIELHYHSLSEEHKYVEDSAIKDRPEEGKSRMEPIKPSPSLKTWEFTVECDDKIFCLINSSKKHSDALMACFESIAKIELHQTVEKGKSILLTPKKNDREWHEFNNYCVAVFKKFVAEFVTHVEIFEKEKILKAKANNFLPMLKDMSEKKVDDVTINLKNETIVEVTGLRDEVDCTMEDIKRMMEFKTMKIHWNKNLIYCGIIDELKKEYHTVTITCDEEKKEIWATGSFDEVQQLLLHVIHLTSSVKDRKITDLDDCVQQYFIESFAVEKRIQDYICACDIKVCCHFDGEDLLLAARSKKDYDKAIASLQKMVSVENMAISEAKANVVKSSDWKIFQRGLESKGNYRIYFKEGSIVMVGLQEEIRALRTEIVDFLEEHEVRKDYITIPYGKAKFVLERNHKFSLDSPERQAVKCELSPELGGGICLEGTKKNIHTARLEINDLLDTIEELKKTLKNPGVRTYYLSAVGKEFLQTAARVNNCIILPDSKHCLDWEKNEEEPEQDVSSVDTEDNLLFSDKIGQVTLAVWRADIIKHRCDVIVNASNSNLSLNPMGVSGRIKQYDKKNNNRIQAEMKLVLEENFGSLLPGGAAMTSAGNLPMCKKIVHAVGPRWNDENEKRNHPELCLKSCVDRSLEITEKAGLCSISIPAISCGIFGGEVHTCIPLIVEAVLEYFRDNESTKITAVHFVELTSSDVLNEFKNAVMKAVRGSFTSEESAAE